MSVNEWRISVNGRNVTPLADIAGNSYICTMKSLEHKTGLIFDLFYCIIFLPLLVGVGPTRHWFDSYPLFAVIVIAYLYLCYFTTRLINLPKLILSRKYLRLAVFAVAFVVITYLLTIYPLPDVDFVIPSMSEYQTRVRNYNRTISVWFMSTVALSYSLVVVFVKELYNRMLLQSIAENQRQKAELAVFKAQISPHFLFNTLNSLYSLVIGTSRKAEDAFIKFVEILKYTYVTIDYDYVALAEEISYIQSYIDLQMIRLSEHTSVEWSHSTDNDNTMIPPMIFLTFVENAFKYGASTTAYLHYTLDGFDLDAVDYLHKPFSFNRFETAFGRAMRRLGLNRIAASGQSVVVRQEYDNISIPVDDILYIEAMEGYSKIYRVSAERVMTRMILKKLLQLLPGNEFIRIHRSYIVPRSKIKSFSKQDVCLINDITLPIGRQYAPEIATRLMDRT